MAFIIKNIRTLTTTTTTSTTTTTTTLAPPVSLPISDNSIFGGAFGGISATDFSPTIPLFEEFSKTLGGTIGGVDITIPTNNSNYTNLGNGDYFIDLDITVRYTNNMGGSVYVGLPRVAIDLPFNGLKSVSNTFTPTDGASAVRIYTDSRLAVEFNDFVVGTGSFIEKNVVGNLYVHTTGATPQVGIVSISNINIGSIDFELTRDINDASTYSFDYYNVHGSDIQTGTAFIDPFQFAKGYTFTPSPYNGNEGFASIIRVSDIDTPNFIMDEINKTGYVDGTSLATTTTTTTTTTLPPPLAAMSFKKTGTPSSTPDDAYYPYEPIQIVVQVDSTNFDPVPYRIVVSSPDYPTDIGLNDMVGNTEGIGTFLDGDIVDDDTLLSGNIKTITGTFYNETTNTGNLIIQLVVDEENNGLYILQDTLTYDIAANDI